MLVGVRLAHRGKMNTGIVRPISDEAYDGGHSRAPIRLRRTSSEAAWTALLRRDRHYDGTFVYAAVTTGIYCRPSCPARIPHRRNAQIFWTAQEAERQGYVPCLRCHPQSLLTPAEESIRAALDYIEAHLDQTITLNTLSQVLGLSPHHFREIFKRMVGLSPKAFCNARRIARFKHLLRAGESISSACYQAGFGSSRALYEKTNRGLGMTPAAYRRGGAGSHIRYTITDSALGPVLIARVKHRLCAVLLGQDDDVLVSELGNEFPNADVKRQASVKRKTPMRLSPGEDPLMSKLPISLRRRIFHAKVWHILN
jgi:AraC family transcriptional regulator, regulatory protein of adaptative response / methylated-DNA-[protein]-cysteine methyltransferase